MRGPILVLNVVATTSAFFSTTSLASGWTRFLRSATFGNAHGGVGLPYSVALMEETTAGRNTTGSRHRRVVRPKEKRAKRDEAGRFVPDDDRWIPKYDALRRFHERRGHASVPPAALEEDLGGYYTSSEIYIWAQQQRYNYKHHNGTRMTRMRVELLNDLNFTWDVNEARWEAQYELLRENCYRHGTTAVRQNTTLGHWVYKQRWYDRMIQNGEAVDVVPVSDSHLIVDFASGRKVYKGKSVSPLTQERRRKLDAIGFIWDHNDAQWEENHSSLVTFHRRYNSTRVPETRYKTLGQWVRRHRAEWKRLQDLFPGEAEGWTKLIAGPSNADKVKQHSTFLTLNRVEKLNRLGFEWALQRFSWECRFEQLLEFKSKYGHVDVPTDYNDPSCHPKLGIWLADQRRKGREYREKGTACNQRMSKDQFDKLNAAGVTWDSQLAAFERRIEELRNWRDKMDTLEVDTKLNKPLQEWVFRTKREYRKLLGGKPSKIDDVKKGLLEEIGFAELLDP